MKTKTRVRTAPAPAPRGRRPRKNDRVSSSDAERGSSVSFPIVGIGASAGGLEAFTQLLGTLPKNTGMAFVFIQHLHPVHESFLVDALAKATAMPVVQATAGLRVEPNHVYVIPSDADISLNGQSLTLVARPEGSPHLPVDLFFRSLAAERGSHAIGIVLSGSASDGTEGLRAIKAEDGITFAQQPTSAKFVGMPLSAVDAGVVDYCLPVSEIATELVRFSRHPYVSAKKPPLKGNAATLGKLFLILRNAVGVDFREYKAPTFERRLARRMAVRKVESLVDYVALLDTDPEEVRHLYDDILIHVTSFFRDPEVFESLATRVLPEILKNKTGNTPVRVWVAGCSTGEEVYSLAISLLEARARADSSSPIQIFGSDIGEKVIEQARHGVYAESRMADVDPERRRTYFTKVDNGYRINKAVRDLCVFVRHDLANDPPFSKLDLVSCRNVLIYFETSLQKRILPNFHYALNQGGFLLLGNTESISGFAQLFAPLDKARKVFARTATASVLRFAPRFELQPRGAQAQNRDSVEYRRRGVDLSKQLDRYLLGRYAPPGVLINAQMDILQFRGDIGLYLRPPPGEPQNNLLKMARPGFGTVIRAAVAEAKKSMLLVRKHGVEFEEGKVTRSCDIVVAPFLGMPDSPSPLFVVLFEDVSAERPQGAVRAVKVPRNPVKLPRRLQKLEQELAATREYMESLVGDQDRANEELNAANEELVSGNEELQSMNEELETAKEELQSSNEELVTVNDELQARNDEVATANSDLLNLLSTVDVPFLFLDAKRDIRRFNPKAQDLLNVLPSDIGRPIGNIKSNLRVTDLDGLVAHVIESNTPHESEVQDRKGAWYRMQVRPYRTVDNRIDGATVSLVDINSLKHHVSDAEDARREAERANRSKDEFLATLSHEIRTPLSSMLMQAQALRQGTLDQARVIRAGEVIERGTRMQVKLIDDLLDVSRIVTGKLRFERRAVDLRAVIRAALESVASPAKRKSIKFEISLDDSLGTVSGDPTRLEQVVTNLLTNAVKFSGDAGAIRVVLDRVGDSARVKVSDNGIGIEPDFLPHVFNRFAQEDGSTVRRHGGLGLGLAIARHLVEAQGGTIHAESAGRGKGATFSVLIPLGRADSAPLREDAFASEHLPRERPRAVTQDHVALEGLRVLVVDDDAETRDTVGEMLRLAGAVVKTTESAAEAMTAIGRFRPEVLVCDIAMPGEDGYSFIRRVRAVGTARGGGNLPALALTAFGGVENRQRALAAGFQQHLVKPVDMDQLTQALADLAHWRASAPE